MKILIVDDIASNRILLDKMVRTSLVFDTVFASDGNEALMRVAESKPDIVLLDVMMPGMNGHEFLRELRSKEEWKSIPVIVTTSSGDKGIVRDMVALNVSGYLLRPFAASQVITAIESALRNAAGASAKGSVPEGSPSS